MGALMAAPWDRRHRRQVGPLVLRATLWTPTGMLKTLNELPTLAWMVLYAYALPAIRSELGTYA